MAESDLSPILIAGAALAAVALVVAALLRKRTRATNGNGELLTPEEIRQQVIAQQEAALPEMEESF